MNKLILLLTVLLIGCGKDGVGFVAGVPGKDGISMGIHTQNNTDTCLNGGVTFKTYVDENSNFELDLNESIKKVSTICNGTNGSDGKDGSTISVTPANITQCSNGGLFVSVDLLSYSICNGEKGDMGPKGDQGLVGAQGPQGVQGTEGPVGSVGPQGPTGPKGDTGTINMTPTQLCPGDTATFKEFGFFVDGELYAVYFDAGNEYVFLARLNPGNYETTNGSKCKFTYSKSNSVIKLSNNNGEFIL